MPKSVDEIKSTLSEKSNEELPEMLESLKEDSRKSVQKLIVSFEKKYNLYIKETNRIKEMWHFEEAFYKNGVNLIAGIDEVGRGPLAGPVVACAVILPKDLKIREVNDSKKLSPEKRNELYLEIQEKAIATAIGIVDVKTIDSINILQSTYKAMEIAVSKLEVKPEQLLIDAITLYGIEIPQKAIIKGDERSISIAAASIVAKVTRDKMMDEYDKLYPQYGFAQNKGYGTEKHIQAIKKFGLCPIHRLTFVKNFEIGTGNSTM